MLQTRYELKFFINYVEIHIDFIDTVYFHKFFKACTEMVQEIQTDH